jgi:hypothetical protein
MNEEGVVGLDFLLVKSGNLRQKQKVMLNMLSATLMKVNQGLLKIG